MAWLLALAAPAARAQAFTKADSGWVSLFDGNTFDGFYSRMEGGEITDLPDRIFSIDSGMIRIDPGGGLNRGHLGTDRKLTHYRARVEYRFTASGGNAGFLYHIDETVTSPQDQRPRSLECRIKEGDAGRAFSNAMAAFTTRAVSGRFDAEGAVVDACEDTSGGVCDARDYGAEPILDRPGEWNRMEVVVRGSDSALHRINDSTVLRLWTLRVPSDTDAAAFQPLGSGSLALLTDGAHLVYRNWEIMELPEHGPSTLQRLWLTNTDGGENLTPGGTHVITWKTLGEVNKVYLFWHGGDGLWEMLADNVSNTGSYAWTVPEVTTRSLRVKVSAAPWVRADSSAADNSIGPGSGLVPKLKASRQSPTDLRGRRDAAGRAHGSGIPTCRRALYPVR